MSLTILFFIYNYLNAQLMQNKFNVDYAYRIVKDTLWVKQKIWKEAISIDSGSNPFYRINNCKDAENFDFIIVPFYKISKKGIDYQFDKNIIDFIEIDTTVFWSFIKYNESVVGFINAIHRNGEWFSLIEVFQDDNPKKIAYEKIIELQPDSIFTIKYLQGLWLKKGNQVYIYSYYNKKLNSTSEYIRSISSIENIHNYARGIEGGVLP